MLIMMTWVSWLYTFIWLDGQDRRKNPRWESSDSEQAKQLSEMLQLLNNPDSCSIKFEKGQSNLIGSVNKTKENQDSIERKITDIGSRLAAVEIISMALETRTQHKLTAIRQLLDCSRKENISLHARLNYFEDRSCGDNLLFYGIKDTVGETWTQTEKTMIDVLSGN